LPATDLRDDRGLVPVDLQIGNALREMGGPEATGIFGFWQQSLASQLPEIELDQLLKDRPRTLTPGITPQYFAERAPFT
jgi:hypothetical protein